MQKKLSIIVPIYNGEKYLRECIDSILNQTYKNIEVVLVDDGSKDSSLTIVKEYAEKNPNVIYVSQTNKGQTLARQAGIKLASGEYIGFVDCDDTIDNTLYEEVMDLIGDDESIDLVSFNFKRFGNTKNIYSDTSIEPKKYNKQEINEILIKKILNNRELSGFRGLPCPLYTKVFKKELIIEANKKTPTDLPMGEDLMLSTTVLLNANNIIIASNELNGYNYRFVNDSISWRYKENLFEKSLRLCDYLKTLSDNEDYALDIQYEYCFITILSFYNEYLFDKRMNLKEKRELMEQIINTKQIQEAINAISYEKVPVYYKWLLKNLAKNKINRVLGYGYLIILLRPIILFFSKRVAKNA